MEHRTYEVDIALLKAEVKNLSVEVKSFRTDHHFEMDSIRREQKELLEFMHRIQGGKAWLFALLTTAATIGGMVASLFTLMSPKV